MSELISLLAICVATLSALYARRAWLAAHRANQLTVQNALRPSRLAVYNTLVDFLHYCSTYSTLLSDNKVNVTRDLVARINRFKWEVDHFGPLDMPEVEKLIKDTKTKAWQLQRVLDRLSGPNPQPIDSQYATAEDNVDGLIDWFATQEKEARNLFEPFLKITQQSN